MGGIDQEKSDRFLGGKLVLRQLARGHRVGTDAILVIAAAPEAEQLADFGCGVGAIGIALLKARQNSHCIFVDRDEQALALAANNAEANGVAARAQFLAIDLLSPGKLRRGAGLAPNSIDLVLANPPFRASEGGSASPKAGRAGAHVMPKGGLAQWLAAALDCLRPEGEIVLIHLPEALSQLLAAMEGRFGSIKILPVHPRAELPAHRLILRARKGSRAALALRPPLVLHGADGRFLPEAEALHRGEAHIAW